MLISKDGQRRYIYKPATVDEMMLHLSIRAGAWDEARKRSASIIDKIKEARMCDLTEAKQKPESRLTRWKLVERKDATQWQSDDGWRVFFRAAEKDRFSLWDRNDLIGYFDNWDAVNQAYEEQK